MIPAIVWPHVGLDRTTPFESQSNTRPLRLTLHSDSLVNLGEREQQAVDLLYEFSSFDELDVLDFEGKRIPSIQLEQAGTTATHIPLKIVMPNGEPKSWHMGPLRSNLSHASIQLTFCLYDPASTEFKQAEADLLDLASHAALDRDIFVTASPNLLARRERLTYANPRTPVEAAAIVGLLLRSRGNWTWRKRPHATHTTDRSMFYWVLMRQKLPNHWRFNSALGATRKTHGDDLARLGFSILDRCARALQARDEIARQFYLPQGNNARDAMMYHFDYLTLLLAGAFDAQAAISNVVYGVNADPWNASFRRQPFLKALKAKSAIELVKELMSDRCGRLQLMLFKIRNTIHAAGLGTYGYVRSSRPQTSFAELPDEFRTELESTATVLGGMQAWGMHREDFQLHHAETGTLSPRHRIAIEPYNYATRLMDEWFAQLDAIASVIEVERLLPAGIDVKDRAPDDWRDMTERFSLLSV